MAPTEHPMAGKVIEMGTSQIAPGHVVFIPSTGPQGVCWEYQAGELPVRLSFTIKVF